MRLAKKVKKKVRERENNGRNKVTYRQNCRQPVFDVCKTRTGVLKTNIGKGRCQKRFSGFCPLRGGGVPPLSAKEKNLLFSRLIFR